MQNASIRLSHALLAIMFLYSSCKAQTSSGITGVWSGVELTISPMIGGGMDRTDITLYLRPDGTFSDEMDKPDWKSRVDGKYNVNGKTLHLNYDDPRRNREITITSDKTLQLGTGYVLRKMDTRKLPVGTYKFQYASGSGGGISGVPYVGTSGGRNIFFDGKGNFHEDGYGTVAITGDNIGGGGSHKNDASGTYTQNESTLTLNYASGKKETYSLFVGDDRENLMVVLNGDLFFRKSEKDITEKNAGPSEQKATQREDKRVSPALTASDLIAKVRAKHGGDAIDKVVSMKMTGKMNGLDLLAITDRQRGWSRLEIRQAGKLVGVEQLEKDKGWTWVRGKKTALDASRLKEMKDGLNTGFNILHSSKASFLEDGKLTESDGNYVLTYSIDGTEFGMMVDQAFRVIGEARKTGGGITTVTFSDFREIQGLLVPFAEKMNDGKNRASIAITNVSINTATDADWKEPSL